MHTVFRSHQSHALHNNNNNNNNNQDDIYGAVTVIMAQSLPEFTRFIWWMQTQRQGGRQPSDQANRLGLWVRQKEMTAIVHIHHRHFIITQPESWYSFYRPMKGGRLSRPRHCSKGVQPVPKAVYRSGCSDKHNCQRWDSNLGPLTPQSGILPLLPICVLVTRMYSAKRAELMEIPFGATDTYGPKEPCSRCGRDLPREGAILGVVRPIEKHWESLLRGMQEKGSFSRQFIMAWQRTAMLINGRCHIILSPMKNLHWDAAFCQNSLTTCCLV